MNEAKPIQLARTAPLESFRKDAKQAKNIVNYRRTSKTEKAHKENEANRIQPARTAPLENSRKEAKQAKQAKHTVKTQANRRNREGSQRE